MRVELLSYTVNPREVIYASARQCYSGNFSFDIFNEKEKVTPAKLKKFLEKLISRGHLSPLEHVSFTFAIDGISRACSHQLVRHRLASYSQQSQRYVSMDDFEYVIPEAVSRNPKARHSFIEIMDYLRSAQKKLKDELEEDKSLDREAINQDLRFVLPQACVTKIVVTMNIRELFHFFNERLCLRAQWEIRRLCAQMLALCKKVLPEVFSFSGPKCKILGCCPEKDEECLLYPGEIPPGVK